MNPQAFEIQDLGASLKVQRFQASRKPTLPRLKAHEGLQYGVWVV